MTPGRDCSTRPAAFAFVSYLQITFFTAGADGRLPQSIGVA